MSLELDVRMVVADCLGLDPSNVTAASSPQVHAEWTSLAHLRVAVAIEEAFGVELSAADILQIDSVAGIVRVLSSGVPAGAAR
ncbi:MAG: acyl carrier protein [Dehalococcoidia bacterium]|nr:acyl carrier protein [Dehalococcoidia bacterium]